MFIKRCVTVVAAMLCFNIAQAQQGTNLESIGFANLPGDSLQVRLEFTGDPPDPTGFVLDNPARISVDLMGVASGLSQQRYNIDSNNVQSVMVLDDGSRTRMVVNLDELVPYQSRVEGNSLIFEIGADAAQTAAVPAAAPAQTTAEVAESASGTETVSITDVSFRRGSDDGEGQVVIQLSSDRVIGNVEQVGGRVFLEFSNTAVPERLNRRYDVTDFGTAVTTVDVLGQADRATVVVDVDGAYEYVAFQSGSQYTISVQPPVVDVATGREIEAFSGSTVSVTYQDIPIRSVLQILADEHDLNLVTGTDIAGNITLHLENVPWDQALELVLRGGNLGSRLEGNVLYVAPNEEIVAQEQQALEASQQTQALAPLYTEYVQINYANAGNILALLTGGGSGGAAEPPPLPQDDPAAAPATARSSGGVLSSRGSATVDQRTNMIIVRDIEEKLEEVRDLVARLDIPVRQVSIEARIVNVSTDYGRDLGVRWGGSGSSDNFRYGGSLETTLEEQNNRVAAQIARQNALAAGETARLQAIQDGTDPSLIASLVQQAINAVPIPLGETTFPDALVVDLGVQDPQTSSFSIGYGSNSTLIELELSALESSGNGQVMARPKVTTQDKMTAIIESGVRIPYQAQAGGTAGGSTTEFEEALLLLEVTPQITPDGRIIMDLNIRQDSVSPTSGDIPAINTNAVDTSVLVNNGQTIVLGGVFREESTLTETKTPLLGDIPYLGYLFKRTSSESRRTELLIFITPKIIEELAVR
ncbi:MAG: type IV pilus secretin PilQ [Pseudohongiellaceae bacterium]